MQFDIDFLKGCKRCGAKPKLNQMYIGGRYSYSSVCCTTISGRDPYELQLKWNTFNVECPYSYKYITATKEWEKINE